MPETPSSSSSSSFPPWPDGKIARYTAYRASAPPVIDGRLDEADWQRAPRSPRFRDLITGARTIHDTRAALLWDDECLYVGFWIEEPFVEAALTERDALIYTENDVEIFIGGRDAYYEFEINALGTIYEALFVWEERYEAAGFDRLPGLQRDAEGARPFPGVGLTNHPRGPRLGFFRWDFPGLRGATHVDGTLNDRSDRDRGWTAEIAFPWAGMQAILHGDPRPVPPRDGDVWRMDFSRFNTYREAPPANDSGGWAWSPHGIWDSHVPECWPYIRFAGTPAG
jgi:hypothetical protein